MLKKISLERNLNDTRYACRFVKNYIDRFLCLSENSDNSGCVVAAGQLTAFLRNCWGLNKVREETQTSCIRCNCYCLLHKKNCSKSWCLVEVKKDEFI